MSDKLAALSALAPLRSRLVQGFMSAARSRAGAPVRSLPACVPHLDPAQVAQAKLLCRRTSTGLAAPASSPLVAASPKDVEEMVFVAVCAGNHRQAMDIAQMVHQDPMSGRFRSKTLYLLLLQLAAAAPNQAHLALNLFAELFSRYPDLSPDECSMATTSLFLCFEDCRDFSRLLTLRTLYESFVAPRLSGFEFEARFLAATLHVLLNSSQYHQALELMEHSLLSFPDRQDQLTLLKYLPMMKAFDMMCSFQDCGTLYDWLLVLIERLPHTVLLYHWTKYLDLALSKNHYNLTKLIYSHVIMAGRELLSVDDVLTSTVVADLESKSPVLASLSDSMLQAVLHTLASHGDVSLTLNLIEWHYIHKEMRGESALTKELCIEIVRSYCYHKEENIPKIDEGDAGAKRVLDVLDSLLSRLKEEFVYTDISDAISHKLNTLNIFDQSVAAARLKELATMEFINAQENSKSMARKLTNKNISDALQGNVLMNNKILHQTIAQHLNYMITKNMSLKCVRLYVECLLNHVNKYQNTSGLVSAMMAMKSVKHDMSHWLTPSVFDIVFKSISNSPAAQMTGTALFTFMKQNGMKISTFNIEQLIFSTLRGPQFNELLEYYLYEYLSTSPQNINPHILHRIRNYTHLNDEGRRLLHFLEENTVTSALKLWESYSFRSKLPLWDSSPQSYSKEHYHQIDSRDAQYLSFVLGISETPSLNTR